MSGSGVEIAGWNTTLSTIAALMAGYFSRSNLVLCLLTVMANKVAGFIRGKVSVERQMKPKNTQKPNALLLFFKDSRLTWPPLLRIRFTEDGRNITGVCDPLGVMEGCVWGVEGDRRAAGRESLLNASSTFQIWSQSP